MFTLQICRVNLQRYAICSFLDSCMHSLWGLSELICCDLQRIAAGDTKTSHSKAIFGEREVVLQSVNRWSIIAEEVRRGADCVKIIHLVI